jgi:hypothetical protein
MRESIPIQTSPFRKIGFEVQTRAIVAIPFPKSTSFGPPALGARNFIFTVRNLPVKESNER